MGGRITECVQRLGDDRRGVTLTCVKPRELVGFDVAVVVPFVPVPQIAVAAMVPEEGDHALLSPDFEIVDQGLTPKSSGMDDFTEAPPSSPPCLNRLDGGLRQP